MRAANLPLRVIPMRSHSPSALDKLGEFLLGLKESHGPHMHSTSNLD